MLNYQQYGLIEELPSVTTATTPWSEPIRPKIAAGLAIALIASGIVAAPTPATVEPGRGYESPWHFGWSEPVRIKPRAPWFQSQTNDPTPFPTGQNLSWYVNLGIPPKLDKSRLLEARQQFIAQDTAVLPLQRTFSSWSWLATPVRIKPAVLVGDQPFLFTEPEPPEFMEIPWFGWLSEPIRIKPRAAWFQPFATDTTPFPTGRNLSWFVGLEAPVRNKSGIATPEQAFVFSEIEPPTEMTVDWYAPWRDPVRFASFWAALQELPADDPIFIPLPASLIEGWYTWMSEPVRLPRGVKAWLQQSLAYHPRILPTPAITVTMATTEINSDVAEISISVYNVPTNAKVSIVEILAIRGGAGSIQG